MELPSDTVTLMFTDIEGSTRLLAAVGQGYMDVLGDHRRILRSAFGAAGGNEVYTQGDAFFVVFEAADRALAAAADIQRRLAAHPWPDGAALRVRIGLHTGAPAFGGEDYVGMDLHRGARICAAGHGGQVVLSAATREAIEGALGEGIALRALGAHRLKDIDEPLTLFDLEEALSLAIDLGYESVIAEARMHLSRVARADGDLARAESLLRDALDRSERAGDPLRRASCLFGLARLAADRGDYTAAQAASVSAERWSARRGSSSARSSAGTTNRSGRAIASSRDEGRVVLCGSPRRAGQ